MPSNRSTATGPCLRPDCARAKDAMRINPAGTRRRVNVAHLASENNADQDYNLPALVDIHAGQRLLELLDPLVCNLGLPNVQIPQALEARQLLQPGVCDCCSIEVQIGQVG